MKTWAKAAAVPTAPWVPRGPLKPPGPPGVPQCIVLHLRHHSGVSRDLYCSGVSSFKPWGSQAPRSRPSPAPCQSAQVWWRGGAPLSVNVGGGAGSYGDSRRRAQNSLPAPGDDIPVPGDGVRDIESGGWDLKAPFLHRSHSAPGRTPTPPPIPQCSETASSSASSPSAPTMHRGSPAPTSHAAFRPTQSLFPQCTTQPPLNPPPAPLRPPLSLVSNFYPADK